MSKASSTAKRLCFVSKDIESDTIRAFVRAEVCESLPTDCPDEKNYYHYCILHFPNDNKHNRTNFEAVVKEKLDRRHNYFQYVYFPDGGLFSGRKFLYDVNFNHAVFNGEAYFMNAQFDGRATFYNANFKGKADFNKTKFSQDANFSKAKFFEQAFFRESLFEEKVLFNSATFSQDVYFDSSIIKDEALFSQSCFERYAHFFGTKFSEGAHFVDAIFKQKAFFTTTIFSESVDFSKVTFEEEAKINFSHTVFKDKVYFKNAIIKGYVSFEGEPEKPIFVGNEAWLDLQNAHIEKPERVSFHTVRLQPHWFINVDSRKFIFTDCRWKEASDTKINTKSELESLKIFPNPNALLTKACRQLADNYEESKGFEEASMFRRIAMESKRKENLLGFKVWSLHWWYWLSSLYGESWKRALAVLLGILLIFAIYYYFALFQICPKNSDDKTKCVVRTMQIDEAVQQSLYTGALQNIEYRKTLTSGQDIVILLEKIFAPLQAALLALAIRRKFMR